MSQPGSDLSRNLRNRHIQLIAIGGTIGVGLFLGSARAIHNAGPGLLLAYALGGVAIFFIMRALGELLTYRPVAGSFATYAGEFCGPFAGFVTGWSYWFMWVVMAMAELTAIGIYVRYWFPNVPQWLPPLIALLALYGSNLLAVRVFGELEFWFALIKVVTIVALIIAGLAVIVLHAGNLGATASFTNLGAHGGFLPFGITGVLLTLQIVMFAYAGVELIGVTAGEAQDPAVALPRATNGIITVVVITAASSSCNSGLFSTGRMLWSLAQRGQAPRAFNALNARHVPAAGIHVSAAFMLLTVILNYLVPKEVFTWVTSITLIGTLWTWGIIMLSHRNYRRAVQAGRAAAAPFRMPGAPFANWAVLGFLVVVSALLALDPDTRVALYVAPVWFAILGIGYYARSRRVSLAAAARPGSAHSALEKWVRMMPGAMQLTRMLCGPHSTARLRASCMSAALEMQ